MARGCAGSADQDTPVGWYNIGENALLLAAAAALLVRVGWPMTGGGEPRITKVTSECSWCLDASEFAAVRGTIEALRANGGAALPDNGLTGKQCTSTAPEIAASGGINLDPFADMTFPAVMKIGSHTIRLWSDPNYSSLRFGHPDKMGDVIKQWSGSKQKICN